MLLLSIGLTLQQLNSAAVSCKGCVHPPRRHYVIYANTFISEAAHKLTIHNRTPYTGGDARQLQRVNNANATGEYAA